MNRFALFFSASCFVRRSHFRTLNEYRQSIAVAFRNSIRWKLFGLFCNRFRIHHFWKCWILWTEMNGNVVMCRDPITSERFWQYAFDRRSLEKVRLVNQNDLLFSIFFSFISVFGWLCLKGHWFTNICILPFNLIPFLGQFMLWSRVYASHVRLSKHFGHYIFLPAFYRLIFTCESSLTNIFEVLMSKCPNHWMVFKHFVSAPYPYKYRHL